MGFLVPLTLLFISLLFLSLRGHYSNGKCSGCPYHDQGTIRRGCGDEHYTYDAPLDGKCSHGKILMCSIQCGIPDTDREFCADEEIVQILTDYVMAYAGPFNPQ